MSQDHINSSEEFSDFNTENLNNMDSAPTSPETDRGSTPTSTTSTNATSISDIKPDISKTSLNIVESSSMSKSISSQTISTASLETLKPSKAEKKEKKEKEKKEKKEKKTPRIINFASGVSTSVPLTGERPKPDTHASMDDDVLLAIFIILFDHDPESQGMTVKQICDILVEKHPDMSKLSSKTSNLVSAKLNAYVKKVEKGDSSIHYALSRDWADSSPKRMVYVYRGILSPEYPAYVQKIIEQHRERDAAANASAKLNQSSSQINHQSTSDGDMNNDGFNPVESEKTDFQLDMNDSNLVYTSKLKSSDSSLSDFSKLPNGDLSSLQSISPAGLQLNKVSPFSNGTLDFGFPQLSVPYSVAPVTASLNITAPIDEKMTTSDSYNGDFIVSKNQEYLTSVPDSDNDDDVYSSLKVDFEDDDDDDDDSLYQNHGYYRRGSDIVTERVPFGFTKRSKSISFVNKRSKCNSSSSDMDQGKHNESPKRIVTAAALTPRVPRKQSFANTPNAAAAVAALRVVALGSYSGVQSDAVHSITSSIMTDTSIEPSISAKWLETVRSGFLNQDIESPENVSLAELDTLFT